MFEPVWELRDGFSGARLCPLMTVRIDGRFPGMNELTKANRRNRYVGAKMKSEYTMKAFDAFKDIEPLNDELPIYLDITWMEPNRRRDADNVQAGVKFILDGMVEAGFIPNDTQRYVLGTANRVGKAREPYVDVRIIGTYGATATDGRKAE